MLTFERAGLTFPDNPPESHKELFLITRQKQQVFQVALLCRCVNKLRFISLVWFPSLSSLGMFIYWEKLFHPPAAADPVTGGLQNLPWLHPPIPCPHSPGVGN